MIIYLAYNTVTEKVYIGQTINSFTKRINSHYSYSKSKHTSGIFYKTLKEYSNNILWTILKTCNTLDELNESERYFIKLYKSDKEKYGYNIRPGGYNSLCAESTKLKLSILNKGKTMPQDVREKISITLKGRVFSDEHKEKMKKNHSHYWQNKKLSTEHKEKVMKTLDGKKGGLAIKGIKRSAEVRERMSKAQKVRFTTNPPAFLGKKHSQETINKIIESNKRRYKGKASNAA